MSFLVNWNGAAEPSEEQFPPVKKEKKQEQDVPKLNQNKPQKQGDQSPF